MHFVTCWTREDSLEYGPDAEMPGGIRLHHAEEYMDSAILLEWDHCENRDEADSTLSEFGMVRKGPWVTIHDEHGCKLHCAEFLTMPAARPIVL